MSYLTILHEELILPVIDLVGRVDVSGNSVVDTGISMIRYK